MQLADLRQRPASSVGGLAALITNAALGRRINLGTLDADLTALGTHRADFSAAVEAERERLKAEAAEVARGAADAEANVEAARTKLQRAKRRAGRCHCGTVGCVRAEHWPKVADLHTAFRDVVREAAQPRQALAELRRLVALDTPNGKIALRAVADARAKAEAARRDANKADGLLAKAEKARGYRSRFRKDRYYREAERDVEHHRQLAAVAHRKATQAETRAGQLDRAATEAVELFEREVARHLEPR
jgi:hypothetical protein